MERTCTLAPEAEVLKCHTAPDGTVWFADRNGPSIGSTMVPARFVETLSPDTQVRAVATPENAPLLILLFQRGLKVTIGQPSPFSWAERDKMGPATVLHFLRQSQDQAASRGGWRLMTEIDLPAYEICAHHMAGGAFTDSRALESLNRHPAFRAWSFVEGISHAALAGVLAAILDPRWFVNSWSHDAGSRLRCYFGLTDRRDRGSWPRRARRRLIRECWFALDRQPKDIHAPGAFLWRIWANHRSDNAEWHASRALLDYIRDTWLDAVSPRLLRNCKYDQGLFIPEHYFGESATAAAWRDYMERPRIQSLT